MSKLNRLKKQSILNIFEYFFIKEKIYFSYLSRQILKKVNLSSSFKKAYSLLCGMYLHRSTRNSQSRNLKTSNYDYDYEYETKEILLKNILNSLIKHVENENIDSITLFNAYSFLIQSLQVTSNLKNLFFWRLDLENELDEVYHFPLFETLLLTNNVIFEYDEIYGSYIKKVLMNSSLYSQSTHSSSNSYSDLSLLLSINIQDLGRFIQLFSNRDYKEIDKVNIIIKNLNVNLSLINENDLVFIEYLDSLLKNKKIQLKISRIQLNVDNLNDNTKNNLTKLIVDFILKLITLSYGNLLEIQVKNITSYDFLYFSILEHGDLLLNTLKTTNRLVLKKKIDIIIDFHISLSIHNRSIIKTLILSYKTYIFNSFFKNRLLYLIEQSENLNENDYNKNFDDETWMLISNCESINISNININDIDNCQLKKSSNLLMLTYILQFKSDEIDAFSKSIQKERTISSFSSIWNSNSIPKEELKIRIENNLPQTSFFFLAITKLDLSFKHNLNNNIIYKTLTAIKTLFPNLKIFTFIESFSSFSKSTSTSTLQNYLFFFEIKSILLIAINSKLDYSVTSLIHKVISNNNKDSRNESELDYYIKAQNIPILNLIADKIEILQKENNEKGNFFKKATSIFSSSFEKDRIFNKTLSVVFNTTLKALSFVNISKFNLNSYVNLKNRLVSLILHDEIVGYHVILPYLIKSKEVIYDLKFLSLKLQFCHGKNYNEQEFFNDLTKICASFRLALFEVRISEIISSTGGYSSLEMKFPNTCFCFT